MRAEAKDSKIFTMHREQSRQLLNFPGFFIILECLLQSIPARLTICVLIFSEYFQNLTAMQINRISHIVLFSTSQEFFISENDAIGSLVITDI